jgi:hypothetical protein
MVFLVIWIRSTPGICAESFTIPVFSMPAGDYSGAGQTAAVGEPGQPYAETLSHATCSVASNQVLSTAVVLFGELRTLVLDPLLEIQRGSIFIGKQLSWHGRLSDHGVDVHATVQLWGKNLYIITIESHKQAELVYRCRMFVTLGQNKKEGEPKPDGDGLKPVP